MVALLTSIKLSDVSCTHLRNVIHNDQVERGVLKYIFIFGLALRTVEKIISNNENDLKNKNK